MAELISIIVTTYNREDKALDAVLRSLARQDDSDFEVIIADDGSGEATTKLVDAWKVRFGRRLDHVWHTDRGFRAAEIRNRPFLPPAAPIVFSWTVIASCGQTVIATHRRLAEPGWFVTGNRVLLSGGELTTEVLREKLNPASWGFGRWFAERWRGGVNRLAALLHLPLGPLRRVRQRVWAGRKIMQPRHLADRS